MKVGVFLAKFTPAAGGGYTIQEDIYCSLIELMGESRHTFVLFGNPNLLESMSAVQKSDRIPVVSYSPPGLIDRAVDKGIRVYPTLRRFWKQPRGLDHIAQSAGVEFVWFVSAMPVQADLPYLAMVWDLQHRLQPWFPEVSAGGTWDSREAFYSRFLRRAAGIIVGTEAGRKEVEAFYQVPGERIKVLPHPTPGFALRAMPGEGKQLLERYRIPSGYLFYPAQFWAHKNHANLLRAVRHLRDEYQLTLPVVLVGSDQGNRAFIRQLVHDLDLSEQIHFLGFVPQQDLVILYRNAFALTYLTFFGPENLPPLEAFALGCPVVASNVSGAEEQLGNAALLVDPKDPVQIARAIKSLCDDAELRNVLVQRGLERASKWTGRDFVRGVFSIFDEFESIRYCWK